MLSVSAVSESPAQLVSNATAEARALEACWCEVLELGDGAAAAKITGIALAWSLTTGLAQLKQLSAQG